MTPLPSTDECRLTYLEEELISLKLRAQKGEEWRLQFERWLKTKGLDYEFSSVNDDHEQYEADNMYDGDEQEDLEEKDALSAISSPVNNEAVAASNNNSSNRDNHKRTWNSGSTRASIDAYEAEEYDEELVYLNKNSDSLGAGDGGPSKRFKPSGNKTIYGTASRALVKEDLKSTLVIDSEKPPHLNEQKRNKLEMLWSEDVKVEDINVEVERSDVKLQMDAFEDNEGDDDNCEFQIITTDDEDEGEELNDSRFESKNIEGLRVAQGQEDFYDVDDEDDEVDFTVVGYDAGTTADAHTASDVSKTNVVQPMSGPSRFLLPDESSPIKSKALQATQVRTLANIQPLPLTHDVLLMQPLTAMFLKSATSSTGNGKFTGNQNVSTLNKVPSALQSVKFISTVPRLGNNRSPQQSRLQSNLTHVNNLRRQEEIKNSLQDPALKSFCEFCLKGFNTPAEMTRHMRIHTGVKPYKCTVCEYASSFNGDLVRHLKSRHPGNDPYVCHLCSFTCPDLVNFTIHRRGSHGAKATAPRPSQPPVLVPYVTD